MDRHQLRWSLLKVTVGVLLLSTWVFLSFIFATRPEVLGAESVHSFVRLPASLPSELPKLSSIPGLKQRLPKTFAELNSMELIRLPCWDKAENPPRATAARWVRIVGGACQWEGSGDKIVVRNISNGFEATVFALQGDGLTTDLIPLRKGKNDILIRFNQQEIGAAIESQISFTRN
jgi:hypothetical protein